MNTQVTDYTLATEILGDDFISPEMIAAALGTTYTDEQIAECMRRLPNKKTLEWLRREGFTLIARSHLPSMDSLNILALERCTFFKDQLEWFRNANSLEHGTLARYWLMLHKGIVPNSTFKDWWEQGDLVRDFQERPNSAELFRSPGVYTAVPNVPELLWGVNVYMAVRGVNLLGDKCARTSSVNSSGEHLTVGLLPTTDKRNGKHHPDSYYDAFNYANLGVACLLEA